MRTRSVNLLPLSGLLALLLAWQGLYAAGRFPAYLFPGPMEVARSLWSQATKGGILEHVMVSLYRFFAGYLAAVAAAVPLGLLLGWSAKVWKAIDPVVQILRPISPVAWLPLVTLWFGIGDLPAIVIIIMAAFYPVLLSTVSAVKNVDPVYLKVARNFGAGRTAVLWRVVVPAAFPYITLGLRTAVGTSWVFLVAGEMMGVRSGLGFLIIDARNQMDTASVMAAMALIGLLGFAVDRCLGGVERLVRRR
ncbi:MAG: ABC transporter permease, partial [Alicyclobacillaceae bacterium]|nr:ABC transporter permease [Alicyclobacillaceae bacterium]